MTQSIKLLLAALALAAFTAGSGALAHSPGKSAETMSGQMHGGMMTGNKDMHHGRGSADMPMHRGKGHMGGHQGAMHHGDRGAGAMMESHHKDRNMMRGGLRVRPIQHLSVDDVSHYFEHFLKRRGNKRLKLGEVVQTDEDTITAQIVTVDGSLVQTYEVDRHSGIAKRTE